VLAELERQLAAVGRIEEQVTQRSQVLQMRVDAFRTAKETTKAMYTAAEASLRIAETIEAIGGEPDPDLAKRREDLRAAEERLRELPGSAAEVLGVLLEPTDQGGDDSGEPTAGAPAEPPPSPPALAEPAPGLLELYADPLGSDTRVLLALEPSDTVTLLAVLDSPEAVSDHGTEAIRLASELLTEIREGGWPADIDEVALDDSRAFLARFFPADDGSIARRADVLATTVPFARLRVEQHVSIAELADRSGVDAHRIERIEREGLRTALVGEAVALARALGARLDLPGGQGPVAG
jgi:hypothetical protein